MKTIWKKIFVGLGSVALVAAFWLYASAASANITLNFNVATIEVDSTERTATKTSNGLDGYIVNGGTVKVFINDAAGTVVTTDAQAQNIVGLPPGASFPFPKNRPAFTYKTASSTSVLYWFPANK